MKEFFLSIGSNIEPEKNVPKCLELLKEHLGLSRVSSIYETDPVGPAGDAKFWNLVVSIKTHSTAADLAKRLRTVEAILGRKRDPNNRFAPRTIDIDVLPQVDYEKHAFMIVPLAEIAPDEVDEKTGKTFRELAQSLPEGTDKIRKVK